MKRKVVIFVSLFLTPLGVEENKDAHCHDTKNWKKVLQTYLQEHELPSQEVIEPIFYEGCNPHVGRV
ncbi:hypothetical protein [Chlamydia vaughanii]|uniref:hypothetical protein n=1 Tax=Chlamydia vaughanii TaxID=3112552 RepID=UPI0032B28928